MPRVPLEDRIRILAALRAVDSVVVSVDTSAHVGETLRQVRPTVFAKGLRASEVEARVCEDLGVELVENVGKELHMHDLLASLR